MSVFHPYPGLELHFGRLAVMARFNAPHRVLSSCRVQGGLRDDLLCLCNHQACEPVGHAAHLPEEACSDPAAYHALVCREHNLPPATALLTTAANIQCAGTAEERDGPLLVYALCTAGVEGNAARAGDPATYRETENGIEMLDAAAPKAPQPGTINIMLFVNRALTPGAMLEAAILATEAKAAVLQELSIPSLYSASIATGTGTDQMAVACLNAGKGGQPASPLANAGKHSKLGEMLGRAVRRALFDALARQNNLTPASICNLGHFLGRFHFNEQEFLALAASFLSPAEAELLRANCQCLLMDPLAVSSLAALVHVQDQAAWGVLPKAAVADLALTQAALMAAHISGKVGDFYALRQEIEQRQSAWEQGDGVFTPDYTVRLAALALALGFAGKWRGLE